jgi:Asp-tRNA(Asn)/Glu-tRNA(Gln) amidotransferase A subunit family amidase
MPVGLQVVGGKFGEEKCIAVAKVIEEALQVTKGFDYEGLRGSKL